MISSGNRDPNTTPLIIYLYYTPSGYFYMSPAVTFYTFLFRRHTLSFNI